MKHLSVLPKIEEIITLLSAPLTREEKEEGWIEESKNHFVHFFIELKSKIGRGEPLPPMSISRGLDSWGVTRGKILELAATISLEIREENNQAV